MMQMLPFILASLLGSFALAYVLYPIYRHTPFDPTQATRLNIPAHSQTEREQSARTALQEVDLDYQLGNLGESDYRSMRTRYMRRAALAMKSRREREQELDAMIEEKLRLLKEVDGHADE
jgi:hypothetical protein